MSDLSTYKTFIPVTRARARDGHTLEVEFANGTRGLLNLSGLIGKGPWKKLADRSFFTRVRAEFDTVVWPGDIDLSPEYVYEHATPY